jgi:hypothetical protein
MKLNKLKLGSLIQFGMGLEIINEAIVYSNLGIFVYGLGVLFIVTGSIGLAMEEGL